MPLTAPLSRALVAPLLLAGLALPTVSQADFARGFEAWDSGRYKTALTEFRKSARAGDARSQNHLAQMYEDGQGTAVSMEKAVRWYRSAAAAGEAAAQLNLGRLYRSGKGVEQSDAEAVRWYRAAAEQGLGIAQFFMGLMYDTGKGVPTDYVRAYKWFDLAARQGDSDARHKRDRLANHMTPSQVLEAERLSRQALGEAVAQAPSGAASGGPDTSTREPLTVASVRPADLLEQRPAPSATRPQPASSSTAPAPATGPLDKAGITRVQETLNALGYNAGDADGIVGRGTRAAAARFRKDTGTPGDGVDRGLLDALTEVLDALPPRASQPRAGAPLVRRIQEGLTSLGYDPGPADGVVGSRTTGAARQYRRDLGLEDSDVLNQALLTALEQRVRVREAARSAGGRDRAAAQAIAARSAPVAPAATAQAAATPQTAATPAVEPSAPTGAELVKRIQSALNRLGYDAGPTDGVAGGGTRRAIETFQRETGVTADGRANARLLAALEERVAEQPQATPFQRPANERDRIARTQKALSAIGFDPGPVDGVAGGKTREAVKRFQARARLPQDGRITDTLLAKLESPRAEAVAGPRLRLVRPTNERELVRRIQVRLNSLGYPAGAPDGVTGTKTVAAVRDFETASGLPVTGKLTASLLRQLEEADAPRARKPKRIDQNELVRSIQTELNRLGYPAGTADGIIGKRTVNAARAFQKDVGINVTGRLTPSLLRALKAAR